MKPMPRLTAINRPFFDACDAGELKLQRCMVPACRKHIYFPRICCPHCQGGNLEWVPVSGRGTIRTHTVVRRPQHPSFFPDAPYIFLAVTLMEGPLMYSRLTTRVAEDANLIGQPVQVVFSEEAPGRKLPFFELA